MSRRPQTQWPEPEGVVCPMCQTQDVAACGPYVECLSCEVPQLDASGNVVAGALVPYRFSYEEAIYVQPREFVPL